MDATLVRVICAVLAVALLGLIVLRRRKSVDE
jgi:MYXO-CTERM domain-containing protein